MKILIAGMLTEKALNRLLSLTSIKSDEKVSALTDHLVKGYSASSASTINGIDKSNFSKALAELESKASIIELIIMDGIYGK